MSKLYNKGFTLIELILVIAFIAILAGVSLPIFKTFQTENDFSLAASTIAQTMRTAALYSQAVSHDSPWGVKLENGKAILFKGANFATRDNTFDKIFDLPSSLQVDGLIEENYTIFTGLPTQVGMIVLTDIDGRTKEISINAAGLLDY
ncbi:MAG: hypothetical protein ACD_72C00096G0002 [uncultured bacterium]|nr:MAG: hypothetical protein ACD_72C00096G0002 [uncultured bacterium]